MLNERKLTKSELDRREDIIQDMKKNKRGLVKRYGKDAEKVMYGRATNLAKKKTEAMDQERIKEMVKSALMGPMKEDQVEEGNAFVMAADAAKDAGKKEFEFPKGSGQMHPVKIKSDINEWGSSDQFALHQSMHRTLGEPTEFPGLSKIMSAAEDATDFYMDDFPEYETDREGLILNNARSYAIKMFPDFMTNAARFVASSEEEMMQEDLDLGHEDNEPHMLKADLYRIGKYAMELYQMVDEFEEGSEEVDFPHWWQSKVIKAKDALVGAKHYLDFEIKEPQIDAMVDRMDDIAPEMEVDVVDENALGFNDSRLSSDQHTDLDYAVRDDKRYTFGNDPYADDQLRYEYAKKMGFLEEKKEIKEGVWSLGSVNDIKKAIQTMEMGLDMDDSELEQHLQDNDSYFYNVLGDDLLHDYLGRAYDLSAMGNEDRAHNELSDAIGRAYDLLKMQMEKEQNLARPNTSPFNEVANKLAKQLKSK